jgi:hypothetical protein
MIWPAAGSLCVTRAYSMAMFDDVASSQASHEDAIGVITCSCSNLTKHHQEHRINHLQFCMLLPLVICVTHAARLC